MVYRDERSTPGSVKRHPGRDLQDEIRGGSAHPDRSRNWQQRSGDLFLKVSLRDFTTYQIRRKAPSGNLEQKEYITEHHWMSHRLESPFAIFDVRKQIMLTLVIPQPLQHYKACSCSAFRCAFLASAI